MNIARNLFGALVVCLLQPNWLLAQSEGGGTGGTVTFFKMFFVIDDMIGQMIVLILLLLSAFSIAFAIKLFLDFRRTTMLPKELYDKVDQLIGQKRYREAIDRTSSDPCYLGKLIGSALNEGVNGYAAMERSIEETSDAETSRMLRPIEYLNVIGNIAPMMGLFGTVYGMIVAFQELVSSSGRPEPQELAAGISTALVTTFWGLIVAIPALAGYALIRNKVDALTSDGLIMAEDLIRPFRPGARTRAPAGMGPGPMPPVSTATDGQGRE